MSMPRYISITGQIQGNITIGALTASPVGNTYVQRHENEMLVQEFLHSITVPIDPQSGQPAGQCAHKPFIFIVALNKAVPSMYNASASGEMLPVTELYWWHTSVEGKQGHHFTTHLTDSTIVDMRLYTPHCQDPVKHELTQLFEVSLACRKIEWEHVKSGTSGAGDWRAPLEAQVKPTTSGYQVGCRFCTTPQKERSSVRGYVHGRWRLSETSAVARLSASVTLYCHSRFNSELSVLP